MALPPPVSVGFFPKAVAGKPAWLQSTTVERICSVSGCISETPPGWIEAWKHNRMGFYDTPQLARTVVPPGEARYVLFPEHDDKLWPRMAPHHEAMLAHIDEVAAEFTGDEWVEVKPIDVRRGDGSGRYEAVLKMLPKDIPVFRMIKRGRKRTAQSSSYLYISSRWVFLKGLEGVPRGIEMLKAEKQHRQGEN
jgi:hypothetical protein